MAGKYLIKIGIYIADDAELLISLNAQPIRSLECE